MARTPVLVVTLALMIANAKCTPGHSPGEPRAEGPPGGGAAPLATPAPVPTAATTDAPAPEAKDAGQRTECPSDMVHVKKDFCTKVERRCVKKEQDKPNRIEICHEFEEGKTRCIGPRVALDFCIDRYEYPNKQGGHPVWMVDWYDAMGHCAGRGKRLCYEGEWVAACEGPKEQPFPYGWARSSQQCNIDNRWIAPNLKKVYSENPKISEPELQRLDQSVPSGSKPGCASEYGVFDLTGNVDEWTMADRDRPKKRAVFAALKGGAWGHVRNACRPVTTSHEPEFRYYFVSFRCCQDSAGSKPFEPKP